MREDGVENRRL